MRVFNEWHACIEGCSTPLPSLFKDGIQQDNLIYLVLVVGILAIWDLFLHHHNPRSTK